MQRFIVFDVVDATDMVKILLAPAQLPKLSALQLVQIQAHISHRIYTSTLNSTRPSSNSGDHVVFFSTGRIIWMRVDRTM
jgi:hypothetical protein